MSFFFCYCWWKYVHTYTFFMFSSVDCRHFQGFLFLFPLFYFVFFITDSQRKKREYFCLFVPRWHYETLKRNFQYVEMIWRLSSIHIIRRCLRFCLFLNSIQCWYLKRWLVLIFVGNILILNINQPGIPGADFDTHMMDKHVCLSIYNMNFVRTHFVVS